MVLKTPVLVLGFKTKTSFLCACDVFELVLVISFVFTFVSVGSFV
jgi:hypothetical protein